MQKWILEFSVSTYAREVILVCERERERERSTTSQLQRIPPIGLFGWTCRSPFFFLWSLPLCLSMAFTLLFLFFFLFFFLLLSSLTPPPIKTLNKSPFPHYYSSSIPFLLYNNLNSGISLAQHSLLLFNYVPPWLINCLLSLCAWAYI